MPHQCQSNSIQMKIELFPHVHVRTQLQHCNIHICIVSPEEDERKV